jgi:hypothetical protein
MTTTVANLAQIKTQMTSVLAELKNILVGSHYQVEVTDKLQSSTPSIVLTLTSDRIAEKDFRQLMLIKPAYKRWSSDITGISVTLSKAAHRHSRDRVYTNITPEMYAKIKEYLVPLEELIFNRIESGRAAKEQEQQWEKVKAEALKDVIIPPGMNCDIVMGNGSAAGKFMIRFDKFGVSLESTPLTADQVARISALVNEILNVHNLHVIVAAWPENGERVFVWTEHAGWRETTVRSARVVTTEQVAAELEKAKQAAGNQWTVKALPYAKAIKAES